MVKLGRESFHAKISKRRTKHQESSTPYGTALAQGAMPHLVRGIEEWFSKQDKPGYNYHTIVQLIAVPPEVLADLTLRLILDSISTNQPLAATAIKLGAFFEEEVRLRSVKKSHPASWKALESSINKRVGFSYKKQSSRCLQSRLGIVWESWTVDTRCKMGSVFINLFRKYTGLIELVSIPKEKHKTVYHIQPTDAALTWISNYKDFHQDLNPVYLPSKQREGYLSLHLSLIKENSEEHCSEVEKSSMVTPLMAMRKLKHTAWRVNKRVLEVAEYFWKNNYSVADFPPNFRDMLPPKPVDIDTNKVARTEWRRKAAKYYRDDLKYRSSRLTISKILWVASSYKDEASFYFPHQFDFRGRLYAVPSFLNFQGCGLARGLLEFSKGQTLSHSGGAVWFRRAGPALFANIVEPTAVDIWLRQHEHLIEATHKNPTENLWWSNAEEPWQFLAWVFEYHKYRTKTLELSHLPITLDASNNGLQLLSLILRNRQGAKDTNCVDAENPSDVYNIILKDLNLKLKGNTIGDLWLSMGIPRKLVKNIIMTIPYGCTRYRATQIVLGWYRDSESEVFHNQAVAACEYLGSTIIQAFAERYGSFSELMGWMERLAGSMGDALRWLSPSGFPVNQDYRKSKPHKVKSLLFGRMRSLTYRKDQKQMDTAKMGRAFVANFIHSLDAAILHKALHEAKSVDSVATIHDAFATHACDVDALIGAIKRAYVDVFKGDPKVFWRKIFTPQVLDDEAFIDLMDMYMGIIGDFSIDEILTSRYLYR